MKIADRNPKIIAVIFMHPLKFISILVVLYHCAGNKPVPGSAQFSYSLNNQEYRLQSIILEEENISFNRLIADDFLAYDYDLDGVIDHIAMGDAEFSKVQGIYEFGIEKAAQEKKLKREHLANGKFVYESPNYLYEIISYRPISTKPFNKIKIIDKRRGITSEALIALDQDADGTIDQVLSGSVPIDKIQVDYTEMINKGLQKGDLIRIENMILVKENIKRNEEQ